MEWVEELLRFLRTATSRLHPQPTVEDRGRKYRVKFFHLLPFNRNEKTWLAFMIKERAEKRDLKIGQVYFNKKWVYFDVRKYSS